MAAWPGTLRLTSVLSELGISSSTWYHQPKPATRARGRPKVPLDGTQVAVIQSLSDRYPYWGNKRLAVLARREFGAVFSDRLTYRIMRDLGLLRRRVRRQAELHHSRLMLSCYPRSRLNTGKWTSPTCICHKDAGGTLCRSLITSRAIC